jgi:hypothetical protein
MIIWKGAYPVGRYHASILTWKEQRKSLIIIYFLCLVSVLLVKNCPSARCASTATVVCRDVDMFGIKPVTTNVL